jgi:hypothetical protein
LGSGEIEDNVGLTTVEVSEVGIFALGNDACAVFSVHMIGEGGLAGPSALIVQVVHVPRVMVGQKTVQQCALVVPQLQHWWYVDWLESLNDVLDSFVEFSDGWAMVLARFALSESDPGIDRLMEIGSLPLCWRFAPFERSCDASLFFLPVVAGCIWISCYLKVNLGIALFKDLH